MVLIIGRILLVVFAIIWVMLIYKWNNNNVFLRIFFVYFLIIFTELSLVMIATYYFFKQEGSNKWRLIRYPFMFIVYLLFVITFFPVTTAMYMLQKNGFYIMTKHPEIYFFSIAISLFVNTFLCGYVTYLVATYVEIFKPTVVLFLLLFVMNSFFILWFGKLFLAIGLQFNKFRMKRRGELQKAKKIRELFIKSEEIKNQFKKELYVFNFAIIAIATAVLYLLDFEQILCLLGFEDTLKNLDKNAVGEIQQSLLYSFALYTAFDRMRDKWKKTLKDKN